jgi:hypothetical protein
MYGSEERGYYKEKGKEKEEEEGEGGLGGGKKEFGKIMER